MAGDAGQLRLETWSRWHAFLLLGAVVVAVAIGRPWPVAAMGAVSFGVLLAHGRRVWTAHLRVAVPNAITALRLATIGLVGLGLHGSPGRLIAALIVLVFALDALDGWVGRRIDGCTAFGAHFDMETDAFFILVLVLELWTRGQLGPWILVTGVLRYVTVLGGALVAPRAGDMPRSRFGSSAFGTLVLGLIAAFVWPNRWGAVCAALGSALVVLSFARSFYGSYLRRQRAAFTG